MDCFHSTSFNCFFLSQWDIVVKHLRQAAANPVAAARDDKAPKASEILGLLLLPHVVLFSAYLFGILSAITPLAFQLHVHVQDSTPQSNNEAIHKSLRKLQKLKTNGFPTANITKQQMSVNENQGPFSKFFYKQEQLIKPRGRRAMPEEPDLDQLFNGKKMMLKLLLMNLLLQFKADLISLTIQL